MEKATNKYHCWKQPIPTNLIEIFKGDKFKSTIFTILLLRARNEDTIYYFEDGESVLLKRGQCVVGRYDLAQCLGLKRKESLRCYRKLKSIEKADKLLNLQKYKDCSIVTIHDYDEIIRFEQSSEHSVNNLRTINEQSMNTNKSVKSGENIRDKSLIEDKGSEASKKERVKIPNPEVNFVLQVFSNIFKLEKPADRNPRQWAYNISRKLSREKITQLMEWVYSQEWGKKVSKLETLFRQISMFERESSKPSKTFKEEEKEYKNAATIRSY